MLLLLTAGTLAAGYLFSAAQRERRAAEAIRNVGGEVTYDWQLAPPDAPPGFQPSPPGPQWLRRVLGPHWLDSIVEVRLRNRARPEERLSDLQLEKLASLRRLTVWGYDLTGEDYPYLGQLPHLEELSLHLATELAPADAAALATAPRLQSLSIEHMQLSSAALEQLAALPELRSLHLDGDAINSQTGQFITGYELGDDAARAIARCSGLTSLMMFRCRVTDAGINSLCRLTNLETLVISSPLVTSGSFQRLAHLERLVHLGVWQWKINDVEIGHLRTAPRLTSVAFITNLTDQSVRMLADFRRLKRLSLRGESVTDASLPLLEQLRGLEWLDVSDTSINKLGARAQSIRMALPNCVIAFPKTALEEATHQRFLDWKWGGLGK